MLLNFLQVDSHSTYPGFCLLESVLCLWCVLASIIAFLLPCTIHPITWTYHIYLPWAHNWWPFGWFMLGAMVPKDVMNILTGVSRCPESSSLLSPRNHWSWRHMCLSVVDTAELFPRWCQSELQPWVLKPGAPVTPSLSQLSGSGVFPFLMGA